MKLRHCLLATLVSLWLVVLPLPAIAVVDGGDIYSVIKNDNYGSPSEPIYATPGSTITYTILWLNGNPQMNPTQLVETLPQYTNFDPDKSDPGWVYNGTNYIYDTKTDFNGEVSFAVTVDETLPCGLEWIYNIVQIDSDVADGFEENNFSTEQTPVDPGSDCTAGSPAPSCSKIPRYYMYTFRDDNQPITWQTYCYIISSNGYPGVESQARICSVLGFDHVYRATKMVYEGWVYTDCNGIASYGWPDWQSAWYRPKFAE